MKHQELFSFDKSKTYGGSLIKGRRKTMRPLDSRKPLHLVLKTTNSFALLMNKNLVQQIIAQINKKFGIKLYSLAIQLDHVHLQIGFSSRALYTRWIRALTGTMARKITRIKFKFLPFSRVGGWGGDFKRVHSYIQKNQAEADFILSNREVWRLFMDSIEQKLTNWLGNGIAGGPSHSTSPRPIMTYNHDEPS